jgi:tRNA(fMet)-specific endonuclease VapC
MLRYLLDTNIVIYIVKKRPIEILPLFNSRAGELAISCITLSELCHGAEKSAQADRSRRIVEDFTSRVEVLDYDRNAAMHYGQIRSHLEQRGCPIGVNDLHIAAHARSRGLTLVSNNLREFERVPGLLLENWV